MAKKWHLLVLPVLVVMMVVAIYAAKEQTEYLEAAYLPSIDNLIATETLYLLLDNNLDAELTNFTLNFKEQDFLSLWLSVIDSDSTISDTIIPITVINVGTSGKLSYTSSDTMLTDCISLYKLGEFLDEFSKIDWLSTFDIDTSSTQNFTFGGIITYEPFSTTQDILQESCYVLANGHVYAFNDYTFENSSSFYLFENDTPASSGSFQLLFPFN
ncbi:MAG: hypothetical protein ATN33_00390 [Epulopiscium sp. Nele67-Bin001]|nr:MAG: hypothetical protein ATN33_00390 [Epulopiscium sp. Nele67-Bin001]